MFKFKNKEKKKDVKQIYFQDKPITDYADDYIGFESEADMLLDEIVNDSKVIGLISDYGSGKSSIISLLESNINNIKKYGKINHVSNYNFDKNDVKKINIIRVNLFDADGIISTDDRLELHKKMIIELAKHKNRNLKYILKRVNPAYRVIDVDTKNIISKILFFVGIALILLNLIFKTGLLSYWKMDFIPYNIINFFKAICSSGGVFGFIFLISSAIAGKIVISYSKSYTGKEFGEYDAQLLFDKVMDDYDVIVLEDLDRLNKPGDVKSFIYEIYSYYSNFKKVTFILPITQHIFDNMDVSNKEDNNSKKMIDKKYKLFTSVLHLPSIMNSDFTGILRELLISKKNNLSKDLNDIFQFDNPVWNELAKGKDLNIRIIKHRLNEAMHLALSNNSRFDSFSIESCVIFTYLKETYGDAFNDIIKEELDNGISSFKFKQMVDEYLIYDGDDEFDKFSQNYTSNDELERDIINALNEGYIDYNYERYIFNYSKNNKIFNTDESNLYNSYISDVDYIYDENKIKSVLENSHDWLDDAIKRRKDLNINKNLVNSLPKNIFDSISIFDYIYGILSKEEKSELYLKKLSLSDNKSSFTLKALDKISSYYSSDMLSDYFESIKDDFRTNSETINIINTRKKLLNIFNERNSCLLTFYDKSFPIVSIDELNIINSNGNNIYDFIDSSLINANNIALYVDYVNNVDNIETNTTNNYFLGLGNDCVDYISKNLKSLEFLSDDQKRDFFESKGKYINVSDIKEIMAFINNINYSYSVLEQNAIDKLNANLIGEDEYNGFVNSLPFANKVTIEFLENDKCFFPINSKLLDQLKSEKKYYGYYKFKTINDGVIPVIDESNADSISRMIYSNQKFNEYIFDSYDFVNYIISNKIYDDYPSNFAMGLVHGNQTYNLIKYILSNSNLLDVNEYLNTISNLDIPYFEFKSLILEFGNIFSNLNNETYINLYNVSNRNIKSQIKKKFLRKN